MFLCLHRRGKGRREGSKRFSTAPDAESCFRLKSMNLNKKNVISLNPFSWVPLFFHSFVHYQLMSHPFWNIFIAGTLSLSNKNKAFKIVFASSTCSSAELGGLSLPSHLLSYSTLKHPILFGRALPTAKNSRVVALRPLCAIWDLGFWDTCDAFHLWWIPKLVSARLLRTFIHLLQTHGRENTRGRTPLLNIPKW